MSRRILVLGATGYVGGRLVTRLLAAGNEVRVLVRSPEKLRGLPWAEQTESVTGDLLEAEGLDEAFQDVDVVYHLVHSMGSSKAFDEADRRIARNVAEAAAAAGVGRIVYLGGLGELDGRSSAHLRSRAEVGEILAGGPVPVTVLRAAVIIGSGSASFEMLRHLVEKLPVMVTPRWVRTRVQPIAIRDVLRYLVGVIDEESDDDHVFDIGGPDVLTYLEMMQAYARVAGLTPRLVVTVPVLTPKLSSHWVGFVTPVPVGLAKPLVESLAQEVVARADGEDISALVPGEPIGYEQALELALRRVGERTVETSWREAELGRASPAEPFPGDPLWAGGTLLTDDQEISVDAPPAEVFSAVARVGGDRGWPSMGWAWRLRGRIDQVVGGIGLRRGRRDPERLRVGDALDFWRVEEVVEPPGDGLLRLRAEMRLPGRAWLEWQFIDDGDGRCRFRQRAMFAPRGLLGRAYWWVMLPFHGPIFKRMQRSFAADAVAGDTAITSSGVRTAPPEEHDEPAPQRSGDPPRV